MLAVMCSWCCVSAPAAQNLSPSVEVASVTEEQPITRAFPPEVRLRKLHLVRPDLIPYPIAYEVYC
jgi:hypothetical protein